MNDIKRAIIHMETLGCPIMGCTYVDGEGKETERDIQINVRLNFTNPLPWGRKVSKTVIEKDGKFYVQAVDRNKALSIRRFNPEITVQEAARNSIRTFRLDRIRSLRYSKVEIATS